MQSQFHGGVDRNYAMRLQWGKRKRFVFLADRISKLPDEIIVSILSLLSFKEASATCILSTRWMHLCRCYWRFTRRLDLSASDCLRKKVKAVRRSGGSPSDLVQDGRVKYFKWVNKMLKMHMGSTIDEFRIGFDLNRAHRRRINAWLRFAFSRRVKKLELNLLVHGHLPILNEVLTRPFVFPDEVLAQASVKSLKQLSLKGVKVTDEHVCYFLSNCPLLEQLIVDDSKALYNVEVCGPSLALRHLEIVNCFIESIRIQDSKLVSFTCLPRDCRPIILLNNPLLVEVHIGLFFPLSSTLLMPSNHISQLEVLTFNFRHYFSQPIQTPQLPRLMQLTVEFYVDHEESLLGFTPLMNGSPRLQKFVMKINASKHLWRRREMKLSEFWHETRRHDHLKVAVVEGYYAGKRDLEVVSYLLQNAVALEELIIDSRSPYRADATCDDNFSAFEYSARSFARVQLEGVIPPRVKLSIL